MTTKEKELVKWLSDNSCVPRGCGKFSRIICKHVTKAKNDNDTVVETWEVPEIVNEAWFEDQAAEIMTKLNTEAANLEGIQSYCLFSYFTESADKAVNRHLIRIGSNSTNDLTGFDSEGPDKEGLVSQAMRHQEINAKIYTASTGQLLQSYQQMINRLSGNVDKLLEDKYEREGKIMELMTMRREDELETRKMDMKQKAIEKTLESVGLLVPVIVNKLAGQKIMPEAAGGAMMMGKSLFSSLSREQLDTIVGSLTPEQQVAFLNLGEALTNAGGGQEASSNGQKQ